MTRIGLLSDVHANLPALTATLAALRERGVDELLVAGDLVGYGGYPNECVEALVDAGAHCVAGNHDLFVVDRLPETRFPELARRSADVTRALLSDDVREVLASLPVELRLGSVLVTHGSLDSPEEYVRDTARALELLRRLPSHAPGAHALVLGHTHRQWCVLEGRGPVPTRFGVDLGDSAHLLNPGSVGQSRQWERRPRARAAMYDSATRRADFIAVQYDVAASSRRLQELDLPYRCLHAPPRLSRSVGRAIRRSARTLARR